MIKILALTDFFKTKYLKVPNFGLRSSDFPAYRQAGVTISKGK
jgi:hypothetical protein